MTLEKNRIVASSQDQAENAFKTGRSSGIATYKYSNRFNMPFLPIREFTNEDSEDDEESLSSKGNNSKEYVFPNLNVFA